MIGILIVLCIFTLAYFLGYYIYDNYFRAEYVPYELLKSKRVIITGASRGIGEQFAYEYAKHGTCLILASRQLKDLESVAQQCRQLGYQKVECVQFDAGEQKSCQNLIETSLKHYNGIDILVLNHTQSV
ncbi:unnamed protein product [Didymodactylos carnosus]|uniref:Uncharacterized protein n=1 Tax=Didymodactylos carnosus TaxID=1234261 RepID=A0A815YIR4_9BILA|nr:unnamed protein product [Didymodactylos carnosus]CAF1571229.1 unnamed protein product [Didymodactylos carnosus]CAF3621055.1 unnamed protein product [Didymodactylos carnosus]CAF4434674.1 unnamed protein product [Didymodactylos carnosus]